MALRLRSAIARLPGRSFLTHHKLSLESSQTEVLNFCGFVDTILALLGKGQSLGGILAWPHFADTPYLTATNKRVSVLVVTD